MSLTAFLFPGQGSQYKGMGKSLANAFPSARHIFQQADDALGFSISSLCWEGPEEELKLTENTQPAMLTVSIAAWTVLHENRIQAAFVAGHSLGEYSALVAAGAIAFEDAVRLVRKRGQYMQEAVPAGVGAMAAILKLPEGKLDAILAEAAQGEVVTAANLNSPDQVVIAGNAAAVARASELAKTAGAKRAIPLPVSAPFHCPLMNPAKEKLAAELKTIQLHDLQVPLINNWEAREIRTAEEAREGLIHQVPSPVRWVESIRYLAVHGVSKAIEVGAGAVLSGLVRQIEPSIECKKCGEEQDIRQVIEFLAPIEK